MRTLVVASALALVLGVPPGAGGVDPASVTVYPAAHPRGLMVTTGGWPYCLQVQRLALRTRYTLACGRYALDGYTGYGLRARRHVDWGNPAYLASFAGKIAALHARVGGSLVLIGVSYSGFGVATLASHRTELRPTRLIVIDSYLNLVARRAALPASHPTAREIDAETGGSLAALEQRTVSVGGLRTLVRGGTKLTVVWSTSASEQREFAGATCNRNANAGTLAAVATALGGPVAGWVTHSLHGHDLWDSGRRIVAGHPPGRRILFEPGRAIPPSAVCD